MPFSVFNILFIRGSHEVRASDSLQCLACGSGLADTLPPEVSSRWDTKHLNQTGGFEGTGEMCPFVGRSVIGRIIRAEH